MTAEKALASPAGSDLFVAWILTAFGLLVRWDFQPKTQNDRKTG